jgi:hypothetical protein
MPTVSVAGNDQTICAASTTLSGNMPTIGTGLWTVVSGTGSFTNASSPTSDAIGLGVGENVLRWTVSNGSCTSSDELVITRMATPTTASAGSDQNVCDATAALSGNTPTDGVGLWTVISGTATIIAPNSPTSGVTGLMVGSVTLRWTINNLPCSASTDDIIITRVTLPTVSNAGSDQTVCATTATLAGNTPTIGTGSWSVLSGTATITTPSSPTSGVTGLGVGTNILRWIIGNSPCTASSDEVVITRMAPPTTSQAGQDQAVCNTGNFTLNGNPPVIGTGQWTRVSGTSGTLSNASLYNSSVTGLSPGSSATFRWTISNAPCAASTDDVVLTCHAFPTTPNAGVDQNLCGGGGNAFLSGNSPVVGTGMWTKQSGTGVISNPAIPNSNVSGIDGGTSVFRWTITNGSCSSFDEMVVRKKVEANAGPDIVCTTASTVTLAGNAPPFGYGTWTVAFTTGSASVSIQAPSNPASLVTITGIGTVDLRWTLTQNPPCGGGSNVDHVKITKASACRLGEFDSEEELGSPVLELDIQTDPNPFTDQTMVTVLGTESEYVQVILVDVNGKIVYENTHFPVNESIPLGEKLSAGIYLLKLIDGDKNLAEKLVKF